MTDNHDYDTPKKGATNWHVPLNENFENIDTDVEVRDVEANRSSYDPKAGAKFVETDTGIVYLGDGSNWQPVLTLGRFDRGTEQDNESVNVVFGHPDNTVAKDVVGATIAGGGAYRQALGLMRSNRVDDHYGTVGGGEWNEATGNGSTVSGGRENSATARSSVVSGGRSNRASGVQSTVGGGEGNSAKAGATTISGGSDNEITGHWGVVAGGNDNSAGGLSFIGGGYENTTTDANYVYETLCGGYQNQVAGAYGTIGGGSRNSTKASEATIGGGHKNTVTGESGTVSGGEGNGVEGRHASVGGGGYNDAIGENATIPGGYSCSAKGEGSFAAGTRALADAKGSFVWADASTSLVRSTVENEFKVQAGGGVVFYSRSDRSAGVSLSAGSGSWSSSSSREAKEDIQSVDPGEVLDGVRELDVSTWSYTAQDDGTVHMGPMAEDFHDAFGLGEDETRISAVDADGVAFAAVQGLASRVDQQVRAVEKLREDNSALRQETAELEARLAALEERVEPDEQED